MTDIRYPSRALNSAIDSVSIATVGTSLDVNLHDGAGTAITSQVNGAQQALDVGVNVAGVQVDPRAIRALTATDVVTANQGGTWNITNISGTVSLPTGAATSAKQPALGTSGTPSADVLTVQGAVGMTALKVDGSGSTQPVSGTVTANQGGTWNINNVSGTVSLPTGAATSAKQPALGTAGTASSDVITVQGIASMTALKVDGSGVTQPVSGTVTVSGSVATSSESPTSAAVPVNASYMGMNVGGTLTGIPGNSNGVVTSGATETFTGSLASPTTGTIISSIDVSNYRRFGFYITTTAQVRVEGSHNNSIWFSISSFSEGLINAMPGFIQSGVGYYSGHISFRYLRVVLVNNPSGTTSVTLFLMDSTRYDFGGRYVTISGTTTVSQAGRARAFIARNNYVTTPVTTSAYTTLVASVASNSSQIYIFDSSGSAMILATGAAGSEVDQLYIPPGGNDYPYTFLVVAGARVSIKALDTNATTGQMIVTAIT